MANESEDSDPGVVDSLRETLGRVDDLEDIDSVERLENRLDALEDRVENADTVEQLEQRLDALEDKVEGTDTVNRVEKLVDDLEDRFDEDNS